MRVLFIREIIDCCSKYIKFNFLDTPLPRQLGLNVYTGAKDEGLLSSHRVVVSLLRLS